MIFKIIYFDNFGSDKKYHRIQLKDLENFKEDDLQASGGSGEGMGDIMSQLMSSFMGGGAGGSDGGGMAGIANLLGASGSSGGGDDIGSLFKSLS